MLQVKRNFESAGGKVHELTAAEGAELYESSCCMLLPSEGGRGPKRLAGRLLIDCMGNASPIVRQVRLHPSKYMEAAVAYVSAALLFQYQIGAQAMRASFVEAWGRLKQSLPSHDLQAPTSIIVRKIESCGLQRAAYSPSQHLWGVNQIVHPCDVLSI